VWREGREKYDPSAVEREEAMYKDIEEEGEGNLGSREVRMKVTSWMHGLSK
jgi:hypothetical protein